MINVIIILQMWLFLQVYNDGIRNMNLRFILTKLCAPVIGVLGMSLSVPYVVARSIVPFLGMLFLTAIVKTDSSSWFVSDNNPCEPSWECLCIRMLYYFSGFPFEVENLVLRRIYPFLLACIICVLILIFQIRQFKRLYEHIKNDK